MSPTPDAWDLTSKKYQIPIASPYNITYKLHYFLHHITKGRKDVMYIYMITVLIITKNLS